MRDLYSSGWQVVEEREGGAVRAQAVFSPGYIDELVLRDRDADGSPANGLEERLWAQQDANFNVTALTDGSGAVVERYVYDPYGAVAVLTPTWGARAATLYGWGNLLQGARRQASTGYSHFRHRELLPGLGRWSRPDPLGLAAGDANLYRWLGNGPAGSVDPLGLQRVNNIGVLRRRLPFFGKVVGAGKLGVLGGPYVLPVVIAGGAIALIKNVGGATDKIGEVITGVDADDIRRPNPRPPRRGRRRPPCWGQPVPSDATLRVAARRLHEALELKHPWCCKVVVATASLCIRAGLTTGFRRSVYSVSSNETSQAQRDLGDELGYFRIHGVANMGPDHDQTHAEQMILNYALVHAHLRVDVDTPIAPYPLPACGPARANCAARIAATPGARAVNPL